MAVIPARVRGLFFIVTGGIVFLLLLFYNDVHFMRSSFRFYNIPEDFDRLDHPPRPQYPPFHPPPVTVDEHDYPRPTPDSSPDFEDDPYPSSANDLWDSRAESVKEAFLHAYNGYKKYAPFPADELLPLTNGSIINFNGWGVSMVDALDTMLIMGLHDEFDEATQQVASINFSMPKYMSAPFFETVIRYVGGFLSAYALSGEPIMLSRAEDLAWRLLPVFNTSSGLPVYGINVETGEHAYGGSCLLAEMASCQMEYKYLAHLTGRDEFFNASDYIMDIMINTQNPINGMWPTTFNTWTGEPVNDVFTVGALADSAYEYLLKQYIMSNKTETRLAELYMSSITGILANLVYISPTRNLVYVTDTYYGMRPTRKFEHLACFFPGLLALGASSLPPEIMTPQQKELHMWAAEAIGHSCWVMYMDRKSGLGPESVTFDAPPEEHLAARPGQTYQEQQKEQEEQMQRERWVRKVGQWITAGRKGNGGAPPGVKDADMPWYGKDMRDEEVDEDTGKVIVRKKKDYFESQDNYFLRPETLESMFVLWRTTGDSKWRDRGWEIWSAIENNTKTPSG
ncbi:glycoside hydrolase family 47 protein, partial [Sphaerobolus stellatus SS14]